MNIPDGLVRTTLDMRGEAGETWLEALPNLVAGFEERWSIEAGKPFANLSYNFAAPAKRADGERAVLKISFPEEKESATEAAALELFDGRGACRLLELDLERGAMLLERLEPGENLEGSVEKGDDESATATIADVMERLWRPAPKTHAFPTVAKWAEGFTRLRSRFGGGTGPAPPDLVEEAEETFARLLATEGEPTLLHGDLHHGNVLSSERGWLAIDPKGVVGEKEYETAAMLRNPAGFIEKETSEKLLEKRIETLSGRLALDEERVRRWAFAQSVLSAVWSLEDGFGVWEEALAFARLLYEKSG